MANASLVSKPGLQIGMYKHFVQPKLEINTPGDMYEQEADAMGDSVMRSPSTHTPVKPITGLIGNSVQRKCAHCEEDDKKKVMRKTEGPGYGTQASPALVSTIGASKGTGSPLPMATRNFMENAFSTDFSRVRVHTDSKASEMSKDIYAKAFTTGSDIYFKDGEYQPDTHEGRHLLAHELTHVIQQGTDGPLIQRKWDLASIKKDDKTEINYTNENGVTRNAVKYVSQGAGAAVSASTWQTLGLVYMEVGGQAQVSHWVTMHYLFKNDKADTDLLQLSTTAQVSGNAKAEDTQYARAASIVYGRKTERTAANPTPPDASLFTTLEEGGISAATVGPLGTIDAELPIGEGSLKVSIPLTKVTEGTFFPYADSTTPVATISNSIDEVDVIIGARVEADADISTNLAGAFGDENKSLAAGLIYLNWETRTAPGAGTKPDTDPGADSGTTTPTDPGILTRKWGCTDVRCNVYPVEDGAVCPKRVIGNSAYIYSSEKDACSAAEKNANSNVPRGCNKRHCNCNTKCSQK